MTVWRLLQYFFAESESWQAPHYEKNWFCRQLKRLLKVLHTSPEQVIKSIPLSSTKSRLNGWKRRRDPQYYVGDNWVQFAIGRIHSSGKRITISCTCTLHQGWVTVSRIIVCTSPGNRYQRRISVSSCGGLFPENKHSTYKHHLMCYRWRPVHDGRHHGFLSYLKKAVLKVLTVHCVIHQQHLVAKNLIEKLHESLSTVITAVNKIKANALNSRLIHELCIENDEDFQCLLLHTEVRSLSKSNCLKGFTHFFQESNPELFENLKSSKTDCLSHRNVF